MAEVNGKYQLYTFEWKNIFKTFKGDFIVQSKFSSFFRFCGYSCQLCCTSVTKFNQSKVVIRLQGNPAPYQRHVSCYYSVSFINSIGDEIQPRDGWIHSSKKIVDEVIFEGVFGRVLRSTSNPLTFCFMWREKDDSAISKPDDQVKPCLSPGKSTLVLECATQTEDTLFSHKESFVDISEQATQTELTEHTHAGCPCINKENKTDKFLEILSRDLGSFYERKVRPDCVLNLGETKFLVHCSLLSARSPVFEAMFCHDTSESQIGEVDIIDINAAAFSDVIYYMYTGKVRGLSPDTAALVYTAADKYALIELREECLNFLIDNLTLENICDAAVLSHSHAELRLEDAVVKFIKTRLRELMESDNWKTFSENQSKLANKLLCSALLASQTDKF